MSLCIYTTWKLDIYISTRCRKYIPTYLHYIQVAVPVVTPEQCATTMGPMEEGMICAGGVAGEDSCQGGR